MELISLDIIDKLPKEEQVKIKVGIIETNDLSMIPSGYLPTVHSIDYYFVSYSHKDYRLVYRDIFDLQNNGLNIWYDRGIPAGKDWRDIAGKYMAPLACKGVLFYISENSLQSKAIMEEIKYAINMNKPFISINLPFETDYTFEGKSVKGETYSASKMIDIMLANGVSIAKEFVEFVKKHLSNDIIFLPISSNGSNKKEKILSNIPDIPKLKFYFKPNGWAHCEGPNDMNIKSVEFEDLNELITHPEYKFALGRCSFANCTNLVSAHVCVNSFNDYSFYRCPNLVEVINKPCSEATDEVQCWNACFMSCYALEKIDISQFSYIGDEAFAQCNSLKEVHIEAKHVGRSAFFRCQELERVYIGKNVEEIGETCFKDCPKLKEIVIHKDNPYLYLENGVIKKR